MSPIMLPSASRSGQQATDKSMPGISAVFFSIYPAVFRVNPGGTVLFKIIDCPFLKKGEILSTASINWPVSG